MTGRLLRVAAAALGALALSASAASAATVTVTSTADSGPGTIRAALAAANDGDTIVIPPGTYAVTSEDLDVSKAVTLQGSYARTTILKADGDNRVLAVSASSEVTIQGLTVTGGGGAAGALDGAGIRSTAPLKLTAVSISGNGTNGGDGGGLWTSKPVDMKQSLVSHDDAVNGAGMVLAAGAQDTSIVNSTIAENYATGQGGGIQVLASTNPQTVLTLDSDTLAFDYAGQGSAVWTGAGSKTRFRNSLITGNYTNTPVTGPECTGTYESLGGNYDPIPGSGCNANDVTSADPRIDFALRDNGGPTDTVAMRQGTDADDLDPAGPNCQATDQRGVPRPQGSGCAPGAYERSTPTATIGPATSVAATSATVPGSVDTRGLEGTATLEYGETSSYGAQKSVAVAPKAQLQDVSFHLTGLQPKTTYHARLTLVTGDGTVQTTDETFTTGAAPPKPSPPPPCRVPNLQGLTLGQARVELAHDHCRLGKVSHAKKGRRRRHPVVVKQSPRPFVTRANGARVAVTLSRKKR